MKNDLTRDKLLKRHDMMLPLSGPVSEQLRACREIRLIHLHINSSKRYLHHPVVLEMLYERHLQVNGRNAMNGIYAERIMTYFYWYEQCLMTLQKITSIYKGKDLTEDEINELAIIEIGLILPRQLPQWYNLPIYF